jgi:hypothetical protein
MSVRALGIAIRLTLEGQNQMFYPYSWVFLAMVIACGLTQMNYLNKVNFFVAICEVKLYMCDVK